jgi:hypothetical protein
MIRHRGLAGAVKRLETRQALACQKGDAETLHARKFLAVMARAIAALPEPYRTDVGDEIAAFWRAREAGEKPEWPRFLDWVMWNAIPHRMWFPDPLPVALVESILDPDTELGAWQCGECGLSVTGRPASGEIGTREFRNVHPVFRECPHCGGAVGWFAHRNRHGPTALPDMGAELLAGRDPCRVARGRS